MSTLTQSTSHGQTDLFHRVIDVIANTFAVFRQAMTAMRTYDLNRARGASHADAVTRAFEAGYNT